MGLQIKEDVGLKHSGQVLSAQTGLSVFMAQDTCLGILPKLYLGLSLPPIWAIRILIMLHRFPIHVEHVSAKAYDWK